MNGRVESRVLQSVISATEAEKNVLMMVSKITSSSQTLKLSSMRVIHKACGDETQAEKDLIEILDRFDLISRSVALATAVIIEAVERFEEEMKDKQL